MVRFQSAQLNQFNLKKLLLLSICLVSCKDATIQQFNSLGSQHKITQYASDGKIIGEWESTGNINNEHNSDGWYFKDKKTGKLIELTGTLQIIQE